jgi:hypothetical protein
MNKPRRLKVSRGRIATGVIYVGPGSPWANPFEEQTRRRLSGKYTRTHRQHDWMRFAEYLEHAISYREIDFDELIGHDLACSCKLEESHCHADILLAVCSTIEEIRGKKFTTKRQRRSRLDLLLSVGPSSALEAVIFEVVVWERALILQKELKRSTLSNGAAVGEHFLEALLAVENRAESEDD